MCKTKIEQEDSDHILAVGQKVMYQDQVCEIVGIRVWHDLGTLLGPPWRGKPVFDLKGDGWSTMNTQLEEIDLWNLAPPLPEGAFEESPEVEHEANQGNDSK